MYRLTSTKGKTTVTLDADLTAEEAVAAVTFSAEDHTAVTSHDVGTMHVFAGLTLARCRTCSQAWSANEVPA